MSEAEDDFDDEKASADYIAFLDTLPASARAAMQGPARTPLRTETDLLLEEFRKLRAEIAASLPARKTKNKGGAPPKPSKERATAIYQEERNKGRSCKDAAKTANHVAGTTYRTATLKKYARQKRG